MSAILKMLEAAKEENAGNNPADFYDAACEAIPSVQRLVSWVESAEHKIGCAREYKAAQPTEREGLYKLNDCTCGLDEIQSLIRS